MFEIKLALTLARLSEIAYIDEDITGKLRRLGFELVKRLGKAGDLSGFICRNKKCDVLVFQGTDLKDWQTIKEDLKFWHTRDEHVRYAAGFLDAYEELLPEFREYLGPLGPPIYITGHSLGGAIALITALKTPSPFFEACYTFGAPRVCGLSGEKHDDGKAIYRVINNGDIVPSLPLMILGYWPFLGELVYITPGYKVLRGWKAYIGRIWGQAGPLIKKSIFGAADAIKKHLIGKYIEALKVAIVLGGK